MHRSLFTRNAVAVAVSMLTGLVACATTDAAPAPPGMRVLVKLAKPVPDGPEAGANLARDASRAAGLSVSYLAPVSAQWHALQVACDAQADCDTALQKLREATGSFVQVERDERRGRHAP